MLQPKHIIVGWSILFSFLSFAQSPQDSSRVFPPVEVTEVLARTILVSDINYSSPRYVLDIKRMDQLGVIDLGSAMKFIPGAQVRDYGGIGGLQTVAYRSLGAAHTGLSLDHQIIRNTQSGSVNLSGFETFGLSRFVFSAGQPKEAEALPSLYLPANSMTLVSKITEPTDSLTLGLFQNLTTINAFESGLFVSVPLPSSVQVGIQFNSRYGNGRYKYDYPNDGFGVTERLNSSLRRYNSRLFVSKKWKKIRLTASGRYYSNDQELPGAVILYLPSSDQALNNEQGRGEADLYFNQGSWKGRVNGFYQFDRTVYSDPTFPNSAGFLRQEYQQVNSGGGIIVHRPFSQRIGKIFFGSDMVYSNLLGNDLELNPERVQSNSVLGYNAEWGPVNLESNLSFQFITDQYVLAEDRMTRQFQRLSPFVSLSYRPWKKKQGKKSVLRFRTFYKNTFRLPSFNDLYYNVIGNTQLRPESADIFDLGLTYGWFGRNGKIEFSMDGFYSLIQDKIVAIPTKDLFNWSMQNVGSARVSGVEFGFSQTAKKGKWEWSHTLTGTLNQSIDVTDSSHAYGDQIPYIPLFAGTATASIGYAGFSWVSNLNYTGIRYSLNENIPANQLDRIWDVNTGIEKRFKWRQWTIMASAKVMNLLGVNYEVIRSYPMPGRYGQFSLKLNLR